MTEDLLPTEQLRRAATVILWRRAPEVEVFLAQRNQRTRFFPGYHVFPGGTLDASDGAGDEAWRTAALRELFEEVGVLVTEPPASTTFPRSEARAAPESLRPMLEKHDLKLATSRLVEAGRLVTPAFAPLRYDTQFFALELPPGETPSVDGNELVAGEWHRPDEALDKFLDDAWPVPPPTIAMLRLLVAHGDPMKAAAAARATDTRPHHERFHIEFHPGIYALPLRAPTLPPATTQNCYVIDADPVVVMDPGTPAAEARIPLLHTLDTLFHAGRRRGIIVLTHHHRDHVGSAEAIKARYGFEVVAHAETAARLPEGLVTRHIAEGDALDLGEWRGRPWQLEALHTPGHAPGHLALRDTRWGAIFAGDLVSTVSTILVDPDEGDMEAYMDALERCASLEPPLVMPGHGPATPSPAIFHATLAHRRMREEKVIAALRNEPRTDEDLLAQVYDDTPKAAWPLAARSLEAHLRALSQRGAAMRDVGGWRAT